MGVLVFAILAGLGSARVFFPQWRLHARDKMKHDEVMSAHNLARHVFDQTRKPDVMADLATYVAAEQAIELGSYQAGGDGSTQVSGGP